MYWGKTLDQCTDMFCLTSRGPKLNYVKQESTKMKSPCLRNCGPKEDVKTTQRLNQMLSKKRSLKKHQNVLKSPQSASTNATNDYFRKEKQLKLLNSPTKVSVRKSSQNQMLFHKQNYYATEKEEKHSALTSIQRIHNIDGKVNSVIVQSPKNNVGININHCSQTSRNTFRPGQNQQKVLVHTFNFTGRNLNETFQNHYQSSKMKRLQINQNSDKLNRNLIQKSPTHFNSRIQHQNFHFPNNHSFAKKPTQYLSVNETLPIYSEIHTPIKQLDTMHCQASHIKLLKGDFPTIKQENEYYEQSKSFNDMSKEYIRRAYQDFYAKTKQMPFLSSINNSVQEKQQKVENLSSHRVQIQKPQFQGSSAQNSRIQVRNQTQKFQLSCQDLLMDSEKTYKQEQKPSENIVFQKTYKQEENLYKDFVNRRQLHQPSICFKLIQSKIRAHVYQMSRSSSNNDFTSCYQTEYPSEPADDPQTINQNISNKNYQQCNLSPLYFQRSKKSKVNFKIEDQMYLIGQNTDRMSESLIKGLIEEKQNNNDLKLQRVKKLNHADNNLILGNLLRQVTNLKDGYSDRQYNNCSIRKNFIEDKKVKTLINRKMTVNSIPQEDSSVVKSPSQQHSNTIMSKYVSDSNLQGFLSSRQNFDRDESTVIGRYTFHSTIPKLL